MSEAREGLLDTNVVILLERLDAGSVPELPTISAVTLAELSAGPGAAKDPREAALRQIRLQNAEADLVAVAFDAAAARAFGQVIAAYRSSGRKAQARNFDALIAATAMSRGLPLYTVNPRDFEGISGLTVVPVPHPDRP